MGFGDGASRTRENVFKKFVEIRHVKLINVITFQNFHDFLREFGENIKIIENSIRPRDLRGPPRLSNFCDFFLNFPLAT